MATLGLRPAVPAARAAAGGRQHSPPSGPSAPATACCCCAARAQSGATASSSGRAYVAPRSGGALGDGARRRCAAAAASPPPHHYAGAAAATGAAGALPRSGRRPQQRQAISSSAAASSGAHHSSSGNGDSGGGGARGQQQRRPASAPPEGLRPEQLPRHVAIIMDGNSRYAQSRGWAPSAGHEAGVAALRRAVAAAARFGVRALTVYAFSEENWGRGDAEVAFLMTLFDRVLSDELPALHDNGVRLRFIGSRARLPVGLQSTIARAEAQTAANPGLLLTVAVSYSAQADIAAAARALAEAALAGEITPDQITPGALASRLSTAGTLAEAGPPDLCIRTSATQRLSNFLLFELAYAELYFEAELWPAFGEAHLERALRAFAASERRFGGRRPAGV